MTETQVSAAPQSSADQQVVPTERLNIVHCLSALSLGGSELATVELAEGQNQAGHRVTLVASAGPLSERCKASGLHHLDWNIGSKRISTLAYIRRLRHWLLANKVHIVHVQARLPAWIVKLALRGIPSAQRPVWITTIHGQYSISAYSRVMTQGDGVIAVSEAMRDWAFQLDPALSAPLAVIYGGVDPLLFRPDFKPVKQWSRQFYEQYPHLQLGRTLSLVARGTRLKNHAGFIRLIAALRQQGHAVNGLLIGGFSQRKSHYREELEQLCKDLRVQESIYFLGDRHDIRELMSISDIVVNISTKAEAFGRTLAEALALGRPVLSWDRGGASEILAAAYPAGAVVAEDDDMLLQQALALLQSAPKPGAIPYQLARTTAETLSFYRKILSAKKAFE